MIFAIGDIHGELEKLRSLIAVLSDYQIDRLLFLGDYIDKGYESKQTLMYLQQLSKQFNCTFLEGDHETAWLNSNFEYLNKYGGYRTLNSFGFSDFSDPEVHSIINDNKEFFYNLKKSVQVGNYQIIHTAGRSRYEFLQSIPDNTSKKIIFGHTAFYTPYVDKYKIGIDTGAVYSAQSPLTAFELTEQFFINHFGEKKELTSIALDSCPIIIRSHDKWHP